MKGGTHTANAENRAQFFNANPKIKTREKNRVGGEGGCAEFNCLCENSLYPGC